jgi:hypothetical protein
MIRTKLSILITFLLIHNIIFCSKENHTTLQTQAIDTSIEQTPIDAYLESKYIYVKEDRKQILCNKAFDYAWKIPNEHPKKKQSLLYQICVHAKNSNHKIDPYFTENFLHALSPIYTENHSIAQSMETQDLSLSCRKKRHAKKIAFCYEFFQSKLTNLENKKETLVHQKQGLTLRDMAEDRFSRK